MLEIIAVVIAAPVVVFGLHKLKSFRPQENDLTPYLLKINKQKERLHKNKKTSIF